MDTQLVNDTTRLYLWLLSTVPDYKYIQSVIKQKNGGHPHNKSAPHNSWNINLLKYKHLTCHVWVNVFTLKYR